MSVTLKRALSEAWARVLAGVRGFRLSDRLQPHRPLATSLHRLLEIERQSQRRALRTDPKPSCWNSFGTKGRNTMTAATQIAERSSCEHARSMISRRAWKSPKNPAAWSRGDRHELPVSRAGSQQPRSSSGILLCAMRSGIVRVPLASGVGRQPTVMITPCRGPSAAPAGFSHQLAAR